MLVESGKSLVQEAAECLADTFLGVEIGGILFQNQY